MKRDKILVLKNIFAELLDQELICVSNSLAGAPVPFVKKKEEDYDFAESIEG